MVRTKFPKLLLKVLRIELDGYNSIINNISKIYSKLSDKEPHETSTITKIMTWYGIKIRVSSSNNTSKIAELFIQGNNMGIIEGTRLLNNKKMPKKIKCLVTKYVDICENTLNELKKYL